MHSWYPASSAHNALRPAISLVSLLTDSQFADDFAVAERAAGRIVSLPMSPTLTVEQVARVCDVLGGAL